MKFVAILIMWLNLRPIWIVDNCEVIGEDTARWSIEVPDGERAARTIARKHNLKFIREVIPDSNVFLVADGAKSDRSKRSTADLHSEFSHHTGISWHQRERIHRRVKRTEEDDWSDSFLLDDDWLLDEDLPQLVPEQDLPDDYISSLDTNIVPSANDNFSLANFNDPELSDMWYINRSHRPTMKVAEAWALGYTGKGVSLSIIDDGIDYTHPDLRRNYKKKLSHDYNDGDSDPFPRSSLADVNRHGTRCAGVVAAAANNSVCAIGIAYNADIGGIRMLDGDVNDALEASSLSHNYRSVDIYSSSWGPDDDGKTVNGPQRLTRRALKAGVARGRDGLGNIFVWASGNGGKHKDDCNCDGYSTKIETIGISAATEKGRHPWYGEKCSSTLATAYSSGSIVDKKIVTTDLNGRCTHRHTGSSAAAPIAAGIIALALEANPWLTWRDVQHLIVNTARKANLEADDWYQNAAGLWFSHAFGFGLMDAEEMVKLAEVWKTVPAAKRCSINYTLDKNLSKIDLRYGEVYINGSAEWCTDKRRPIKFLEHVECSLTIGFPQRGALEIYLASPLGTWTTLLGRRPKDRSEDGFYNWTFMSTHFWGEDPAGIWQLQIINSKHLRRYDESSWDTSVSMWEITFRGTEEIPFDKEITTEEMRKRRELRDGGR